MRPAFLGSMHFEVIPALAVNGPLQTTPRASEGPTRSKIKGFAPALRQTLPRRFTYCWREEAFSAQIGDTHLSAGLSQVSAKNWRSTQRMNRSRWTKRC